MEFGTQFEYEPPTVHRHSYFFWRDGTCGMTHEPHHYASITCREQGTNRNKTANVMYPSLTHYEGDVNESIK